MIEKKKLTYQCEYCKEEYVRLIDAKNCEEECCAKKHQKDIDQVLKKNYKNDTRYKRHCVDCGRLLMEYEYICTSVESYPGDVIFSDKEKQTDFGGLRCKKCHRFIEDLLYEVLKGRDNR